MGLTKLTDYFRPKKLTEAARLLKENDGYFPIGGGTWLVPYGGSEVRGIVDLSEAGIREIRLEENSMYIGASTTLNDLLTAPETSAHPYGFIRETISSDGCTRLINSASTVGSKIELGRDDSSFLAGLVAVNATIILFGKMSEDITLWDYLNNSELRNENHIISGIEILTPENIHSVIFESISYIPSSPPLISLALYLTFSGNLIDSARIVLSSIGDSLVKLNEAEKMLLGKELDDDLIKKVSKFAAEHIEPAFDPKGSAEYKKAMAGLLLERALNKISADRGGS
ncbi:MAG: FAD binding domain-containing protein [Candidatus Marinimicrobia bacterium]|nr:FAD binding domain-containing protein [Candidatus Neomarinimicrobiota bacterium]